MVFGAASRRKQEGRCQRPAPLAKVTSCPAHLGRACRCAPIGHGAEEALVRCDVFPSCARQLGAFSGASNPRPRTWSASFSATMSLARSDFHSERRGRSNCRSPEVVPCRGRGCRDRQRPSDPAPSCSFRKGGRPWWRCGRPCCANARRDPLCEASPFVRKHDQAEAPTCRTTNRPDDNAALAGRGSLSIWSDPTTQWLAAPSGERRVIRSFRRRNPGLPEAEGTLRAWPGHLEAPDRLPPAKSGRGQDAVLQALGRARHVRDLDRQVAGLQTRAAILNRFTALGTSRTRTE